MQKSVILHLKALFINKELCKGMPDVLLTQAKAVSVGKARAGVPEYAGAVDLLQELLGCFLVLCDNDISVGAAVFVNVVHSVLHAVYHLNAALQVPVLCSERLHLRWAKG